MDTRDVELVSRYADVLQIGARNMQNYTLLDEAGKADIPVMVKRGLSATYEDWQACFFAGLGQNFQPVFK